MNSTGLDGSQAANAGETPATPRANAVEINAPFNFIFIIKGLQIGFANLTLAYLMCV
jgi:hypothetical protein